jgi:hypothetical protein
VNYEYVRDATSFSQVLLCLNLRRLKGTPCGYEDLLNKDKIFSCLSIVGGYGDTPSCGVNVNEPRLAPSHISARTASALTLAATIPPQYPSHRGVCL